MQKIFQFLLRVSCRSLFFIVIASCSCSYENTQRKKDYTDFVDPFIGTITPANTFPGATAPFGFIQLSPHTGNYDWKYHAGYQYPDTLLKGFAHTHLNGGGNPALGDLLVLPYTDKQTLEQKETPFSKEEEYAQPGYYKTLLTRDNILVELTSTRRTGIHRYTLTEGSELNILLNIDEVLFRKVPESSKVVEAWFEIEGQNTINGYLKSWVKAEREVFFTIETSSPFLESNFLDPAERLLNLKFNIDDQLIMRVALSTVSIEGAKENLRAECLDKSFDTVHKETKNLWNSYLSKVDIKGSEREKEIFYTNLYRIFIQPNTISDVDGKYRGADNQVHSMSSGDMYSTFPFWDKYRAAYPLYTILIPDKIDQFVKSVMRHYEEKGILPLWGLWGHDSRGMIGNHSVPFLADAYLKGLTEVDGEKLFEAVKTSMTKSGYQKNNYQIYDKYGYFPADTSPGESVSRTLETTYDDWAAAQLAKKLDKKKEFEYFLKRSNYYKNLFDTGTNFFRGRNMDGSWIDPFDPFQVSPYATGLYTEANAWQYLWHVQHDIEGLIGLMGGPEIFASRLDSLFNMDPELISMGEVLDVSGLIGQYAHGNEPGHHIPYLYNYVDMPHRTQEVVNEIMNKMYDNTPDGYTGNIDFGQMNAWYILSALGFYPVDPVSQVFKIGTPSYEYAEIKLDDTSFIIRANNLTEENIFVESVKLNGESVEEYQISYDQIMKGGELIFQMNGRD